MKMQFQKWLLSLLCMSSIMAGAQNVAINSTSSSANVSAMLDISSTSKGLLIPRMSTSAISSIINPAKGLLVYDSTKNQLMVNMGTASSPGWQTIVYSSGWSLTGNSGTNPATNFIGTTDGQPLALKLSNKYAGKLDGINRNYFIGDSAGVNSTGYSNIAIGSKALLNNTTLTNLVAIGDSALYKNGTGATGSLEASGNTAVGSKSLFKNTTGFFNTAMGTNTLYNNTTGERNTAIGAYALTSNITGVQNTATGLYSLDLNTTGGYNTANGVNTLQANTSGSYNSAYGVNTLYANLTGSYNTASGLNALKENTAGINNTATGAAALQNNNGNNNTAHGMYGLYLNTSGQQNTASGYAALYSNTTGSYNTATGAASLNNSTGSNNTATGAYSMYSNTTGNRNTAEGFEAMYTNNTGFDNLASGYQALYANTSGHFNAAIGNGALSSNITGVDNIAIGHQSLNLNKYGNNNTALGSHAQYNDTSFNNTAIGAYALYSKINGDGNTVIGALAANNLTMSSYSTIIGAGAIGSLQASSWGNTLVGFNTLIGPAQSSSDNVCVGYQAGFCSPCFNNNGNGGTVNSCTFLGSQTSTYLDGANFDYHITNSTAIGYLTQVNQDNKVLIGNTSVTSIGGFSDWSNLSDGRYKKNISQDVRGLAFIMKLRPVSFNLDLHSLNTTMYPDSKISEKMDYSRENTRYTGFIAQEVEETANSIGFDFSGIDKPQNPNGQYGLRYAQFVVPLVKAVQEQQQQIESLKKDNAEIKEQLKKLLDIVSKK
jgi:hypothetical protein